MLDREVTRLFVAATKKMRLLPVDGSTDNWHTELNRADDVAGFMIGSALAFVSGLRSISIPRNLDRYRKAL